MTKKKLICRISNGFGNQMFMYAAAYSFAKQLNYTLNYCAYLKRRTLKCLVSLVNKRSP